MKKGWQIVIRNTEKAGYIRILVPRYLIYIGAVLCLCFGGYLHGLWADFRISASETEQYKALRRELTLRDDQLRYITGRMHEIREELANIREVSQAVEHRLGLNETRQEGGIGGPLRIPNRRDIRQITYMNSESELLGQMWSEIQELEQETHIEKEKNTTLLRFLQSQSALLKAIPSIRPIHGGFISSPFGRRVDPFTGSVKMHTGIDIAHSNHVPVYSTAEGIVIQAGWSSSYGNLVTIYHGFGLSTRYAHLHRIDVKEGEWVQQGEQIGLLGNTGRSTHNHLHYEVRIDGRPVNPYYFLPKEPKG